MELVDGELLFELVARGAFNERICRHLFRQIIRGIHHLNQAGVVHRDLKTENLFYTYDGHIKIADFGYAGSV